MYSIDLAQKFGTYIHGSHPNDLGDLTTTRLPSLISSEITTMTFGTNTLVPQQNDL